MTKYGRQNLLDKHFFHSNIFIVEQKHIHMLRLTINYMFDQK